MTLNNVIIEASVNAKNVFERFSEFLEISGKVYPFEPLTQYNDFLSFFNKLIIL